MWELSPKTGHKNTHCWEGGGLETSAKQNIFKKILSFLVLGVGGGWWEAWKLDETVVSGLEWWLGMVGGGGDWPK